MSKYSPRKYKLLDLDIIINLKDKNVAHALGALAADGTIARRSGRNSDRLTIRVKNNDESWVTEIRNALNLDQKIRKTNYRETSSRKTATSYVGFDINQPGLLKPFSSIHLCIPYHSYKYK